MFYAIYNSNGELISTASEIDEASIEKNGLFYKTFDGDDGEAADFDWDTQTLDFVERPEPVIITKEQRINTIAEELGLTPEQKEKLKNVI